MLFDEKTGDTVHMAVGDAIGDCTPERIEKNESAQHDGTFVFEEGVEAE